MRKIGAHVSVAGGLVNSLKNIQSIGGNCLQMFAGSPRLWARHLWSKANAEDFISLAEEMDCGPNFIHALYLVNLATDNLELLDKSEKSLITDIKNGAQIKSAGVIVHIGSHQGRGFESVKDALVFSIQRILKQTDNCDLVLENDAGQNGKIGSLEEISYLIKNVNSPRLKVCLDTAHLFEGGLDHRSLTQVDAFVKKMEDLHLLDRVVCIHLNDSATELDSHHDKHADLGKGEIGIAGLKNFVNHSKLKHLPLILETPGPDKQGPNAENILIAHSL